MFDESAPTLAVAESVPVARRTGTPTICSACGERFNGVASFDTHRIGPHGLKYARRRYRVHPARRCLSVAELMLAEFGRTDSGLWRKPSSTRLLEGLLTALGRPYWPRVEQEDFDDAVGVSSAVNSPEMQLKNDDVLGLAS